MLVHKLVNWLIVAYLSCGQYFKTFKAKLSKAKGVYSLYAQLNFNRKLLIMLVVCYLRIVRHCWLAVKSVNETTERRVR